MSHTTIPGALAAYLRQLRQSRGQSLAALAARSGVNERSLSRWENGAARPRLPELDQALRALGASPSEQARARGLAGAARARVWQQREAAAGAAALLGEPAIPPGPGALLRALRHRRGLSLAETASRLRLRPSSVSRWERSEMLPETDHLEALLGLLEARPEEREALRAALAGAGPLAGWTAAEEPLTLEALQGEFTRLSRHEMWQEAGGLLDLGFVSLEAQLWSLALHEGPEGAPARSLLARACAYHAFWLSNAGRLGEAAPLAWRCRRLCEPDGPESHAYLIATIISARWAAAGGVESRARARRYLESALPWERHPDLQAWAMSKLGHCLMQRGDADGALHLAREGRALAGRYDAGEAWHRKLNLVELLLQADRGAAALDCLATDPQLGVTPGERTREALLWAAAHLAVGDRREAQAQLEQADAAIRVHNLDQLRPALARLAAGI
jgi:transcriptional regulator with XRE-family HTH domain